MQSSTEANAWRQVIYRKISRNLKSKVLHSWVVPARRLCRHMPWIGSSERTVSNNAYYTCQICEDKWIIRIVGAKRVERRGMKDIGEASGTEADDDEKWGENSSNR